MNVGAVTGQSTFISSNQEITLFGGGTYDDGIPPIYVGFREPLDVRVIDGRVNGQRVNELVVDGVSQHTFTVEVTFAGKPVPDGTEIELNVTGENQNIVVLSSCIQSPAGCVPGSSGVIFANQINDPIINPQNNEGTISARSLAFFTIDPLSDVAFNAKINVTSRFDQLNTVVREITRCIEINNTVNVETPSFPPQANDPIEGAATSNELILYDTIQDLFFTTRAGEIRRIGHFAAATILGTGDFMYVFGGITGQGDSSTTNLTPLSEVFNVQTQEWEFTTDMPTPRVFGMTVVKDEKVYCIGGLEVNPLLAQYVVSRRIEMFDSITELWNTSLAIMPEDNGVAYGDAQVVGDFIYVTCGVTSMSGLAQAGDLNTKILIYSILGDSWTEITPSNISLYQRLAPFGFYRSGAVNTSDRDYYIYSGSIPKPLELVQSERQSIIDRLLNEFRSFIFTSTYYNNLPLGDQELFVQTQESIIIDGVQVPGFLYLVTGFRFAPGSEFVQNGVLNIDISDTLDDEWTVLPQARDMGAAVYSPLQDIAFFIGGSNQNKSTTLNRNESIDLHNDNDYSRLTPLNRGRTMFGAVLIGDEIFLTGGLTSGHSAGFVEIDIEPDTTFIEARGTQSAGLLVTLKNDSGEVLEQDVRIDVRGRLRMPAIDDILSQFIAERAADRALGGDGTGTATDLPQAGEEINVEQLIKAQNKIIDPNSDAFQFNASRKLSEQVSLFPILYSAKEFVVNAGVGGVTLLPRSEDPLADFQKLSEFIRLRLENTPVDPNERFSGDLTREELAALGDTLATVQLPPTVIKSGSLRDLYSIETLVTILDPILFGQTISDFDLDVQEAIDSKIVELLTPPEIEEPGEPPLGAPLFGGGSVVDESECFLLQHAAQPDIPPSSTPPASNPNTPLGIGGFAGSGQCLFCQTILPTNVDVRNQLSAVEAKFFNVVDWMPQIKKRLVDNTATLSEVVEELDIIDHEVPFGGSQLYNAMFEAGATTSGDEFALIKKVVYIASDNSQNLSLVTRDKAIDEINAIDGDKKVPVIYSVFSTSFPISLAAQLQRSEVGDVEKITQATGGQATTLIRSGFLDQILNLALGSATGGLGFGIHTRKLIFLEPTAITAMTLNFRLPSNTQGFVRIRFSPDGFNFGDFGERFEGSQIIDLIDFVALIIEIEVVLTTGFTIDISEEYDSTATGIPKLVSIVFQTSGEREDLMFLDKETVLTNVQQVAAAIEGTIPTTSIVEIGSATSNSHEWTDFQSPARPAVRDCGKMFMLERTDDPTSLVPIEPVSTIDGRLYVSNYGRWDPAATVSLFEVNDDGVDIPVLDGFVLYPRDGEVYFDTKQPPDKQFKITIVNDDCLRVGLRLRNRLHTEAISLTGVGFIYSTNDEKPLALSQVAPRAISVQISPQSPSSGDTFFALYVFVDLNNDKESGTLISWFRNGSQLLEIQNQTSWSNTDLLPGNKLEPNDKINFRVIPSDGRDFGTPVVSPTVVVVSLPPGADDVRMAPFRNNILNGRFDTSSTFVVEYDFRTEEIGSAGVEDGTIIRWFVNGTLFKEGTFSGFDIDTSGQVNDAAKQLAPTEIIGGTTAHIIGNQVQAEVTPKTLVITGDVVKTQIVTVENSIPIATNVKIEPEVPTAQSTLVLTYDLDDNDINVFETQTDQSELKWFNSANGTDFIEVTDLQGESTVPPFFLRAGEHWFAQVTAFDGLDVGNVAVSNTVVITP